MCVCVCVCVCVCLCVCVCVFTRTWHEISENNIFSIIFLKYPRDFCSLF